MLPIGSAIDTDPIEFGKLTNLLGRYSSGGASSSGDSGNKTEFETEIVEEWLMKNTCWKKSDDWNWTIETKNCKNASKNGLIN